MLRFWETRRLSQASKFKMSALARKDVAIFFILSLLQVFDGAETNSNLREANLFQDDSMNPADFHKIQLSRSSPFFEKRSLHPNANNLIFGRKRTSDFPLGDFVSDFPLSRQMKEFCSGINNLFLGREE